MFSILFFYIKEDKIMASIKVETGLKTYDIEDENGNIRGQITINPSDVNFIPRARQMKDAIQEHVKKAEELAKKEGLTEDDIIAQIASIDADIKAEINKLFNANVSSIIFGEQSCLNTLNGISFVERFMTAVMPIIEAEFAEEQRKSAERVNKYVSQASK